MGGGVKCLSTPATIGGPLMALLDPLTATTSPGPASTGALYRRLLREAVVPYAGRFAAARAMLVASTEGKKLGARTA